MAEKHDAVFRDRIADLELDNQRLVAKLGEKERLLRKVQELAVAPPDYAEVPNSITGRALWQATQLEKVITLLAGDNTAGQTQQQLPAGPEMVGLFDLDVL